MILNLTQEIVQQPYRIQISGSISCSYTACRGDLAWEYLCKEQIN